MVRRRLLWALALGVPLVACTAIVVAAGAFVGTTYLALSFGAQCQRAPGPCGGATATAIPYAVAALALAALTPYVILITRWVRDASPPPRSPSAFMALLRVLTGCAIGTLLCASSFAGSSWLWMTLNNDLYYGVSPVALLLTMALGCAYPVLYLLADRSVDVGR